MFARLRCVLIFLAVVVFPSSSVIAGEPVNRDGQWGLGLGTGGIGVRYWATNGVAVQVGTQLDWWFDQQNEADNKRYNASIAVIPTLVTRGNLRFEAHTGFLYEGYRAESTFEVGDATTQENSYTLSAGLGAEYYFDELPSLTFGFQLAGIYFMYSERERTYAGSTVVEYPKEFATFSRFYFSAMYYF